MRLKKDLLKSNIIAIFVILIVFFLLLGLRPTGRVPWDRASLEGANWDFRDDFDSIDLDTWEVVSDPIGGVSLVGDGSIIVGDRSFVSYTLAERPVHDIENTIWSFTVKGIKGTHPHEGCFQCPDVDGDGNINIRDMVGVSSKNGLSESDSGYIDSYDLTSDGMIDKDDTACVSLDFGESPDDFASCSSTVSDYPLGAVLLGSTTSVWMQIYEDRIVVDGCSGNPKSYPVDIINEYHTFTLLFEERSGDARLLIDPGTDDQKTVPTCRSSGGLGNPSITFSGNGGKAGYALQLDDYYIFYSFREFCEPNWNCAEWSECSIGGRQTRLCTDMTGCQDGGKAEFQPCVPTEEAPSIPTPPPAPDPDDPIVTPEEDSTTSTNDTTSSGSELPFQIGDNPALVDACNSLWDCGSWTPCSNGARTRKCADRNACVFELVTELKTCLSTAFGGTCSSQWACGDWRPCVGSIQFRGCEDTNGCFTPLFESQVCNANYGSVGLDTLPERKGSKSRRGEQLDEDDLCSLDCIEQGFEGGLCGSDEELASLEVYTTCQSNDEMQSLCQSSGVSASSGYLETDILFGSECSIGKECQCVNLNCCTDGCDTVGLCQGDTLTSSLYSSSQQGSGGSGHSQSGFCAGCFVDETCLQISEVVYYGTDVIFCKEKNQVIYLDPTNFCTSDSECEEEACINYSCGDGRSGNIFSRILGAIKEVFTGG